MTSDTFRPGFRRGAPDSREIQAPDAGTLRARADRLRLATESVVTLPTLPAVFDGILRMMDDPNTSSRQLARALSRDQVLTARLLRTANSAFYGFPRKVATANLALVVLGLDATRDVVLATSVMETFRRARSDGRFDMARFWDHSLATAVAARELARRLRWEAPGEAFTAGLLHDIGQVVLHEQHPDLFQEALRRSQAEGAEPALVELETIGATHSQVGGWLCRRWNLPDSLCDAVECHHAPDACPEPNRALAALVSLADHLAHRTTKGGAWGGSRSVEVDSAALEILSGHGLGRDDLPFLIEEISRQVERADSLGEALR